jgi:hypothetical protein
MREIERRIRKLEDVGPACQGECFAISDIPDDDIAPNEQQISHSVDGGRVIYLLKEDVMSAQEWAQRHCTSD